MAKTAKIGASRAKRFGGLPLSSSIILLVLVLSSCSNSTKSYESIDELKSAFIAAGGQCWEWKLKNSGQSADKNIKSAADCDRSTVLVIYKDEMKTEQSSLQHAKLVRNMGLVPHVLFGGNWMINSDQVVNIQKIFGGTLVTR